MSKLDANDLSTEIRGMAMVLCGLSNQCSDECSHLTDEAMQMALYGLCITLGRIANDVEKLE